MTVPRGLERLRRSASQPLFLPHAFNFFANFGQPRPEPTSHRPPRFEHGTPDGRARGRLATGGAFAGRTRQETGAGPLAPSCDRRTPGSPIALAAVGAVEFETADGQTPSR